MAREGSSTSMKGGAPLWRHWCRAHRCKTATGATVAWRHGGGTVAQTKQERRSKGDYGMCEKIKTKCNNEWKIAIQSTGTSPAAKLPTGEIERNEATDHEKKERMGKKRKGEKERRGKRERVREWEVTWWPMSLLWWCCQMARRNWSIFCS